MANRLLPWIALGCFLAVAVGAAVQFRYAVLSGGGGGAFLWDRWSDHVCLVAYGLAEPNCRVAEPPKHRSAELPTASEFLGPSPKPAGESALKDTIEKLRAAGFSDKEIRDWLAKNPK